MNLHLIKHGSAEYEQMIELRMDILRRPLGLMFTIEQLAKEKDDWLIGAFENNELVGCCVLTHYDDDTIQLRQMAVKNDRQSSGVGKKILAFAEKIAPDWGYST